MTINEIHKSKVLYVIRDEMLDDIISSIEIVNERLHAPIKIMKCGDTIETQSFVNGYEGFRPIIRVEVLLNQSPSELFYPMLRIHDIHHGRTHDIELKGLSIREIMVLLRSAKVLFGRRQMLIQIQDLIVQSTQAERMTVFDIITNIADDLSQLYEYGGCLRNVKMSLL